MEKEKEGLVVRGRVVIDTRQPFRSVKEAVSLFGERVLVPEIYGHMLKQVQYKASENTESAVGLLATELEETKQSLQKAKEECSTMSHCFETLKQELVETKKEIIQLKSKQVLDNHSEIEVLKSVKKPHQSEVIEPHKDDATEYTGKKKCVKFASPSLPDKDVNIKNKAKRKFVVPFSIGALFSKRKGSQQSELSPRLSLE